MPEFHFDIGSLCLGIGLANAFWAVLLLLSPQPRPLPLPPRIPDFSKPLWQSQTTHLSKEEADKLARFVADEAIRLIKEMEEK